MNTFFYVVCATTFCLMILNMLVLFFVNENSFDIEEHVTDIFCSVLLTFVITPWLV